MRIIAELLGACVLAGLIALGAHTVLKIWPGDRRSASSTGEDDDGSEQS